MSGSGDEPQRRLARELASEALRRGEPTAWFEELYARAGNEAIPWADLRPNPSLVAWAAREHLDGRGQRALDIGCGLGDDAEQLVEYGFEVDAVDIAPTAIERARARFPASSVAFKVANVFDLPAEWQGTFDFVLEAYLLQVLPPELRRSAASAIARALKPGGLLLVIARGREPQDDPGAMPWPLTRAELESLFTPWLTLASLEDFVDDEKTRLSVVSAPPTVLVAKRRDSPSPTGFRTHGNINAIDNQHAEHYCCVYERALDALRRPCRLGEAPDRGAAAASARRARLRAVSPR